MTTQKVLCPLRSSESQDEEHGPLSQKGNSEPSGGLSQAITRFGKIQNMAFPLEGQHCGKEHFTHWKRVVAKGSRLRKRLNVTTLCCTDAGGRDCAVVKKRPTRNRATVVFPKLSHVMALVENAIHAWHTGKATGQHF